MTTLTVGPLAASVRTKASVTPGALKATLAHLAYQRFHPPRRAKVSSIATRTSILNVVESTFCFAVFANDLDHVVTDNWSARFAVHLSVTNLGLWETRQLANHRLRPSNAWW